VDGTQGWSLPLFISQVENVWNFTRQTLYAFLLYSEAEKINTSRVLLLLLLISIAAAATTTTTTTTTTTYDLPPTTTHHSPPTPPTTTGF
jgi:hypothetical protein